MRWSSSALYMNLNESSFYTSTNFTGAAIVRWDSTGISGTLEVATQLLARAVG